MASPGQACARGHASSSSAQPRQVNKQVTESSQGRGRGEGGVLVAMVRRLVGSRKRGPTWERVQPEEKGQCSAEGPAVGGGC